MRDAVIIIVTAVVFGALVYGGRLQDQMRHKGYRPGDSIFSMSAMVRSLATVEGLKFALLFVVLIFFVVLIAMFDRAGFLPR